jgi:hypothetical protein
VDAASSASMVIVLKNPRFMVLSLEGDFLRIVLSSLCIRNLLPVAGRK